MVSLVLVDDHSMLLSFLGAALGRRGHIVLGLATSPSDGVALSAELRPDVCVMDRHFPGCDGLASVRMVQKTAAHTKVLVLSGSVAPRDVQVVRASGADGLLAKSASIDEVSVGLVMVSSGKGVWPEPPKVRPARSCPVGPLAGLTPRERQVLELLASGVRTVDVAAGLGISVNTARTHVQRVLAKLGVSNRFQAVHLLHASSPRATEEYLPA